MKRMFIIATVLSVAFASCNSRNSNTELLTSNEWHLEEIVYDGNDFTDTPPANVTVMFSDSTAQIAGRGGCNNFFGTYEVKDNDEIKVNVGGSTLMACPELEFEDKYFGLLAKVDKYTVSKDELWLIASGEGTTLVYKPVFKAIE